MYSSCRNKKRALISRLLVGKLVVNLYKLYSCACLYISHSLNSLTSCWARLSQLVWYKAACIMYACLVALFSDKFTAEQTRERNHLIPRPVVQGIWLDTYTASCNKLVICSTGSCHKASQECKLLFHRWSKLWPVWCDLTCSFEEQAELAVTPGVPSWPAMAHKVKALISIKARACPHYL